MPGAARWRWCAAAFSGLLFVNAADVAEGDFADARLRLKLLGQEVVDLESRGETSGQARQEEAQQIRAEERLLGQASARVSLLEARRSASATEVSVLRGLKLNATAQQMQRRAHTLKNGVARMAKHIKGLRVREESLASTLHAVKARYDELEAAQQKLPAKLETAHARAQKSVKALREAARSKLRKLQQKEKAAAAAHDFGEVAALKWEEGRVKAAYSATKSESANHELKITSDLYVAKKQAPFVAGKKALLESELARTKHQLAQEQNRSAVAQAEARNLTAQAALKQIEASVDIGVEPVNLTNRSLADAERMLSRLEAEVPNATAVVDGMKSALTADARALKVQGVSVKALNPASTGGLDASVLDTELATDTSGY
jgi:hypothetical protein